MKEALVLITIDTMRYDDKIFLLENDGGFIDFKNVFATGTSTPFVFPGIFASCYPAVYRPSVPKLAEVLKSNGYATFGHNGGNVYCSDVNGYDVGFDFFKDRFKQNTMTGLSTYIPSYNDILSDFFKWIDEVKSEKIFSWLHFMDLHGRWDHFKYLSEEYRRIALKVYQKKSKKLEFDSRELSDYKNLRAEVLKHLKVGISEIMDFVGKHAEKYILILTSDHGEELMEHGNIDHLPKLYDEILHVPFMIATNIEKLREQFKSVKNNLISLIDLPVTLVDTLGFEKPKEWQGLNFVKKKRDFIYAESFRQKNSPRHDPAMRGVRNYCVRTLEWKYMMLDTKETFFDLQKDPYELKPESVPEKIKNYVKEILKNELKNRLKVIVGNKLSNKKEFKKENEGNRGEGFLLSELKGENYGKVVEFFKKVAPKTDKDYVILSLAYYNLKKRNEAITALKRALTINPGNLDALFNLSQIYHEMRKWSKLYDVAKRYFEIDPNNWQINDMLCDVYAFEGHFEKAIEYLQRALNFAPKEILPEIGEKIHFLKSKEKEVENKPKLAFICAKGLDSFLDDIVKSLSSEYWVKKYRVNNSKEIYSAIDWADIIWFEWANEVAIIGTNYPKIVGKSVFVRLHSYELFTTYPVKINWNNVNKIIFVAPHIKEIFERSFPRILEKVNWEVVYNGIDLDNVSFEKKEKGYDIAWVAHINHKKNPEMIIQIIKKLTEVDERYKIHVAGDFQERRYELYLKHMVKRMRLERNVIFYGWIDDMEEWWKDKNYLLSTSVFESFGFAIIEAMARGIKPVIHSFYGAERLYPENLLFDTIDEAVQFIISGDYNSAEYRSFVERYSLKKQIKEIKKILKFKSGRGN
ncbi:sulfatase-like hydrolase/transferase [Thermosipho ferrireducens]|uniref:sulfatase-like hydrolase/transferase n=1 Tax=Thermosipho ferrireducens TaxID=2571116 RepID=UPI001D18D628|nr:sulfatase-like hydrolase/transferase [Thermosipho ferrireducens]